MTSPGINKPEPESDIYNDVHSRGSGFGQDLKDTNIRGMLLGRDSRPFNISLGAWPEALKNIGESFVWAIWDFFDDTPDGPPPPMYEDLAAAIKRAATPLYSLADQALDKATAAQTEAESISEELAGFVSGDYAKSISDFETSLGELEKKAQEAYDKAISGESALDQAIEDMGVAQKGVEDAIAAFDATRDDVADQAEAVAKSVTLFQQEAEKARLLLSDVETAKGEAEDAAKEVRDTLGSDAWEQAVTTFVWAQDQVNQEQSDFNKGIKKANDALVYFTQNQVKLNEGFQASLDALAMVDEEQSDFNKGVREATKALKEFQHWQLNHNQEVIDALVDQAGVNKANEINWLTVTEYQEQNNRINRSQSDALAYHENQMMWNQWTQVRHYWVGSHPYADGWLSLELVPSRLVGLNVHNSRLHIDPEPGWRGHATVILRYGSFSAMDLANYQIDGSGKRLTHVAGGGDHNYTSAMVIVTPYWSPAPREYLLKPLEDAKDNDGVGFQRTEAYFNELEQNPVDWNWQASARFTETNVVADREVYVWNRSDSYYRKPKGATIASGDWIRAMTKDLVTFTEER